MSVTNEDLRRLSVEAASDLDKLEKQWNTATTQEEKDRIAKEGAAIRERYGYTADAEGNWVSDSEETAARLAREDAERAQRNQSYGGSVTNTGSGSNYEQIASQLGNWNTNQVNSINSQYAQLQSQLEGQQDYATQQTVNELQRQLEDSASLYDQERAKSAYSAAQAKDNMALYNASVGDKGGIGSKLYSEQAANYDAQLLNINLQQAQLKTDIERQVADAKAQGDYAKAQAILELGIQKMSALNEQANNYMNLSLNAASNIDTYNLNKANYELNKQAQEYNQKITDFQLSKEYPSEEPEPEDDKMGLSTEQWGKLSAAASTNSLQITRDGKTVVLGFDSTGKYYEDINTGDLGFRDGDTINFGDGIVRVFKNGTFVDPTIDANNPIVENATKDYSSWTNEVENLMPTVLGRTPEETYNNLRKSYNDWLTKAATNEGSTNSWLAYRTYGASDPKGVPYATYLKTKEIYEKLISQYKQQQ